VSHQTAFLTTVHDPDGRLFRRHTDVGGALASYCAAYAFVTESTDVRIVEALQAAGVEVSLGQTGVPGIGQRQVLAAAVQAGHGEMFYCDYDRWLHWAAAFPDELASLPGRVRREYAGAWYICLGRTDRALATHPAAQSLPEAITNRALWAVAGQCLDATAGAAWIRSPGAKLILEGSTARSKATDLEWPGLVLRADPRRVHGVFLEGLEFETPDGYAEEIAKLGSLDAWIRETYDKPRVLRDRLQLAADSITALLDVTGFR
jgi:hypothetical protein